MIAQKNSYIESAYQKLQNISQDKEKRLEYEAREKAIRDYNQGILEAELRGEVRGEKQGEARGEIRGQTEMILLIQNLIQQKRYDDIAKIEKDIDYRKELCKKYGIDLKKTQEE